MKMTLEEANSKKIIVWWDVDTFGIDPADIDLIEWINQELIFDFPGEQIKELIKEYEENNRVD